MDDNKKVASQRLIEIKRLKDQLAAEESTLRAQLEIGDSYEDTEGNKLSYHPQVRTSYDEVKLLESIYRAGLDPYTLGEVRLKVDKKLLAEAPATAQEIALLHSETSESPTLRITLKK
jgi:hypothetical protein